MDAPPQAISRNPRTQRSKSTAACASGLAPQGITGTNYLEIDYVDPSANPVLPIDWTPLYIYVPSARSTVTTFVDAATEIVDRLHNLDIEGTVANLNRLLVTTNDRIGALDTKAIGTQTERTLAKIESTMDGIAAKQISTETLGLLKELRQTNQDLKATIGDPAWRQVPKDASAASSRCASWCRTRSCWRASAISSARSAGSTGSPAAVPAI